MSTRIDGNLVMVKSVHNESKTNGGRVDLDIFRDFYRLQILYKEIIYFLNARLTLYNNAQFEDFILEFSNEKLVELNNIINDDNRFFSTSITELKDFVYDKLTFDNYRSLATNLTGTVQQAISEYYKIKTLQAENIELKTYKEILENREKLIDYINTIQKTSYLFSAEATYTNNLEIKLWYQVYLERYGPPGDGIFDGEKLSAIIEELIIKGLITEDEVLS